MPDESREIRFDKKELTAIAGHYLELIGHPMSVYKPESVVIGCEPARALRVIFIRNAASSLGHMDMSFRVLEDALICYCRDHDIPIPRAAEKIVQTDGDEIILTIRQSKALHVA